MKHYHMSGVPKEKVPKKEVPTKQAPTKEVPTKKVPARKLPKSNHQYMSMIMDSLLPIILKLPSSIFDAPGTAKSTLEPCGLMQFASFKMITTGKLGK
jgi:hypothetical protein